MAKVKGPLFSLSAGGQVAKTLVYGAWKGVDWVRQYVIPANPQSELQQAQRTIFKAAVTLWHTAGLEAVDVVAFNLYAATLGIAMSGFNAFVRLYTNTKVADKDWTTLVNCLVGVPTSDSCAVTIDPNVEYDQILYIGTSKTAMHRAITGAAGGEHYEFAIDTLLPGTTYYFYIIETIADFVGRTGIYSFKTAEA